jgi:hypothetical protein
LKNSTTCCDNSPLKWFIGIFLQRIFKAVSHAAFVSSGRTWLMVSLEEHGSHWICWVVVKGLVCKSANCPAEDTLKAPCISNYRVVPSGVSTSRIDLCQKTVLRSWVAVTLLAQALANICAILSIGHGGEIWIHRTTLGFGCAFPNWG